MAMTHQSRFSDVCGTIDELKRLLRDDYAEVALDPEAAIAPLLADARFMLGRMRTRLAEYEEFKERLREVLLLMDCLAEVHAQPADEGLRSLGHCIRSGEDFGSSPVLDMEAAAESIRAVAGSQEDRLRGFMDLALKAGELFEGIRGARPWLMAAAESAEFVDELVREYQAWMPPEPHRSELLKFLAASRATVVPAAEPGSDPVVQFHDGGAMRMSLVRYDAEIRNFRPASRPGSTGA
jgi:hypothetical protein